MRREKVETALLAFVVVGTTMAIAASMAHQYRVLEWGNESIMPLLLAFVTATMNLVFMGLSILTRDPSMRRAVNLGIVLLGIVEFWGNMTPAGLLVRKLMPVEVDQFYNVNHELAIRAAAFLTSGFLPVLNLISSYCLGHAALRMLSEDSNTNRFAEMAVNMSQRGAFRGIPETELRSNGGATR